MDIIFCPHCKQGIRIETHVQRKEKGRGPTPHDFGSEFDDFLLEQCDKGVSLAKIADLLNSRGLPTPRGKTTWYASTVQRARDQALKRKKEES
jgi:Recombinase